MTEQQAAADDVFRVGSRVELKLGRRKRTVLATVTHLPNGDGRQGIVYDGDQTGAVHWELRRHMTPVPLNIDELHADALRENAARDLFREIQDCSCVEYCNEDPRSACSLSGRPHVHPASQGPGFGPCPVHPERPGDH